MKRATHDAMRNFHLPLPPTLYAHLRVASVEAGRPLTALVRSVLQDWIARRRRVRRSQEIAVYASEAAGTPYDLDPSLEAAATEELRGLDGPRRRK